MKSKLRLKEWRDLNDLEQNQTMKSMFQNKPHPLVCENSILSELTVLIREPLYKPNTIPVKIEHAYVQNGNSIKLGLVGCNENWFCYTRRLGWRIRGNR